MFPQVLAGDADGVGTLLRDAGVIDGPGHHAAVAVHLFEDGAIGDAQECPVVPRRERHEVVERLMASRYVARVHASGDGLDALALAGEAETHEVRPQRIVPILVAHGAAQLLEIAVEAAFLQFGEGGHNAAQGRAGISRL